KFASRLVGSLYSEGDSPLRYRINRLGGRSAQDKWILQAELFNELHRWVNRDWRKIQLAGGSRTQVPNYYGMVRDFFKAAERVWGEAWGHSNYMATKPVTLKAMLRVCADLAREDGEPAEGRVKRWEERRAAGASPITTRSGNPFGDRLRSLSELVEFVHAVRAVPDDSACLGEPFCERRSGTRADIENHVVLVNLARRLDHRLGRYRDFFRADHVHRQRHLAASVAQARCDFLRLADELRLGQRLANFHAGREH